MDQSQQQQKIKVLDLRILRGPNYWSNHRKQLIEFKLDLQAFEFLPTHLLPHFATCLESTLPSLQGHFCSKGKVGGFFERLQEGTWLGHVIEHVALELQTLAGMDCGFGRTRSADQAGVYYVVFNYQLEQAGEYAAYAALRLVESLANNIPYDTSDDIKTLKKIYYREKLGTSTEAIVNEAITRNIPWMRLHHSLVQLGHACRQRRIWSTLTDQTSAIAVDIAADKALTKELLAKGDIPVPRGVLIRTLAQLDDAIECVRYPLTIKPNDGNHGKGLTINIQSRQIAVAAFHLAQKYSRSILVEQFIPGQDYRMLVVNHCFIAAAKREAPYVIGDGKSTIEELITLVNLDPRRGDDHDNLLTRIKIDDSTQLLLNEQALSMNSVPARHQKVYVKAAANLSVGGIAFDITEEVHAENKVLAERISRLINLDVCGIDLITSDITQPLLKTDGAILEVNAGPGLRMHLFPSFGKGRNVAKPIVDMLFPNATQACIPIAAVTGTNGKTTVVRLLAHLLQAHQRQVGFTTTEGIYINKRLISTGDCSGPKSAAEILRDPEVDFAVFECARGGILREGLGFEHCDYSIVTNVSSDHLGLDDIEDLADMARVKEVIARSTRPQGYAILNADDPLVYRMKENVASQVVLFSVQENSVQLQTHVAQGGMVAFIENDQFVVMQNQIKTVIGQIGDVPLTFKGHSTAMLYNILPVICVGVLQGYTAQSILQVLKDFLPNHECLPGRMNYFHFTDFTIVVDYAHNEQAFCELKHYFNGQLYSKKIGIIAATGDRRETDIQKIGKLAADIFDEIIIRHDADGRGRTNESLTAILQQGMQQSNRRPAVQVISDERQALDAAIKNASKNSLIYFFPEDVLSALDYVQQLSQDIRLSAEPALHL